MQGSRSVSELDPPSSWDDLSAIPTQKPHIRTTTPVYRTNVPEYINFWEGKPLSERQFGVPMHERNAWVRPKSDYGTRFKGVKKKSSKDESGSADDIGSGVQEAWGEQNTKTNDKVGDLMRLGGNEGGDKYLLEDVILRDNFVIKVSAGA